MLSSEVSQADKVSIHAPREGCDACFPRRFLKRTRFQFTHPGRGATNKFLNDTEDIKSFNSRTPGGVRLTSTAHSVRVPIRFNSRTPGGVRLGLNKPNTDLKKFQFTHPGRGATQDTPKTSRTNNTFQFTHPGRGATTFRGAKQPYSEFQFTHPGRGATSRSRSPACDVSRFNSRTPGGVRHARLWL